MKIGVCSLYFENRSLYLENRSLFFLKIGVCFLKIGVWFSRIGVCFFKKSEFVSNSARLKYHEVSTKMADSHGIEDSCKEVRACQDK